MARTFEEMVGGALDTLYQGALFLSGGNTRGAERLLIDSVTLAFEEHAREVDPSSVERWLEARLVLSFLSHAKGDLPALPPETARRLTLGASTFDGVGPASLFEAAASLPAWPRAALWLVLLRRWTYRDAAEALGIGLEQLPGLLAYRDVLVENLMRSRRPGARRTGSD